MDDTAAQTCGHTCPAHPDWQPCALPEGHSPVIGHRDSTGSDLAHTWQDNGHDSTPEGRDLAIMLNAAADAFEAESALRDSHDGRHVGHGRHTGR